MPHYHLILFVGKNKALRCLRQSVDCAHQFAGSQSAFAPMERGIEPDEIKLEPLFSL